MSAGIRVGIVGHGNLGRGVRLALQHCPDMCLEAIFSRRDPARLGVAPGGPAVYPLARVQEFRDALDVLILCGGSRKDLPEQGPALARDFCTVDSFDTHARIPEYFSQVDTAARAGGRLALISTGWDPGLFSVNRLLGEAILPEGSTYTFWGKGLSQGHSDAVRRVPGVHDAVQYTIPRSAAIERVRAGETPALSTRERHTRECFVVLEQGADAETVRDAIVSMPDYFADYDTSVHFIDAETLARDHSAMPHGGFVIRSGQTDAGHAQVMEFSLRLQSNPEFTSSVLVAYARAVVRLYQKGETGAITPFDVAPGLLSPRSPEALRKDLL
ncbi:MAG: diaminopimelate dehydrogenase [Castellaniella sp.]